MIDRFEAILAVYKTVMVKTNHGMSLIFYQESIYLHVFIIHITLCGNLILCQLPWLLGCVRKEFRLFNCACQEFVVIKYLISPNSLALNTHQKFDTLNNYLVSTTIALFHLIYTLPPVNRRAMHPRRILIGNRVCPKD